METNTAHMAVAAPDAERHPQNPTSQEISSVKMIKSRDDVTILLLLLLAIFS